MRPDQSFKGRQFTADVILWAVRWYFMFPVSTTSAMTSLGYWTLFSTPELRSLIPRPQARQR